jgi:hypothetical protein
MKKALTDRFVSGVKSGTRKNYFDTKTRGLVLRVGPRGKSWFYASPCRLAVWAVDVFVFFGTDRASCR